jgi:hypothetical protein
MELQAKLFSFGEYMFLPFSLYLRVRRSMCATAKGHPHWKQTTARVNAAAVVIGW